MFSMINNTDSNCPIRCQEFLLDYEVIHLGLSAYLAYLVVNHWIGIGNIQLDLSSSIKTSLLSATFSFLIEISCVKPVWYVHSKGKLTDVVGPVH